MSAEPASEVARGIWCVRLPIPNPALDHVLVYAVETVDGLLLVDTGWKSDECRAALEAGLASFGASVRDIRGIVTTHLHPDHYGLGGVLQDESGAWLGAHPADAALVPVWYHDQAALARATAAWLRELGAPAAVTRDLAAAMLPWGEGVPLPDRLLSDGELLPYAHGTLAVAHTPGHTPGHIVVVVNGAVITGDHVLPGISPFVSTLLDASPDPLGGFLGALADDRLAADAVALPGHGGPFPRLGDRTAELLSHHDARLAEIAGLLAGDPRTVWDVARDVTWFVPWGDLDAFSQRIALGETHAHLVHLARTGRADASDGLPRRWTRP